MFKLTRALIILFVSGYISVANDYLPAQSKKDSATFSIKAGGFFGKILNPIHHGDRGVYQQKITGNNNLYYGATYSPIRTNLKPRVTGMFEVSYQDNSSVYGIFVSGYYFSGDDSKLGRQVSHGLYYDDFDVGFTTLFGNARFPLTNDLTSSGSADIDFLVKNSASLFWLNLDISKDIFKNLKIYGGLTLAELDLKRLDQETTEAFLYNYWGEKGNFYHFHNYVSLTGFSSAKYGLMIGSNIGFSFSKNLSRKILINMSVNGAILPYKARKNNSWIDIDHIFADTTGANGEIGRFSEMAYWEGVFEKKYNEKGYSFLSTIGLSVVYKITSSLELEGQCFFGKWSGLTKPDKWMVPGAWTSLQGTHWEPQSGSIGLQAIGISLKRTFNVSKLY